MRIFVSLNYKWLTVFKKNLFSYFILFVSYSDAPSNAILQQQTATLKENQNANFICSTSDAGNPEPTFHWSLTDQSGQSVDHSSGTVNRSGIFKPANSSLQLQLKYTDHQSTLKCEVQNSQGNRTALKALKVLCKY